MRKELDKISTKELLLGLKRRGVFTIAPEKTEWGEGMFEIMVEINKDSIARIFVNIDDLKEI